MPHNKGESGPYGPGRESDYVHGRAKEVDQISQSGRQPYSEFSIPRVTQRNSPRK